jgi:hypothetical protein
MNRSSMLVGAALAVVAILTAWFLVGPRDERLAIDLVDAIPEARQVPGQYEVRDLELAGVTHRALVVDDFGRFIFPVTVPNRAWLRVSIGQQPEAWTTEGDGVVFIIGAWDGEVWDEVLSFVVNPFHTPEDRVWHDIAIDLSKYAGQSLELRFVLGRRDNPDGDMPAWGDPRIVIR